MAANDYSMLRDATREPCGRCGYTGNQRASYASKDGFLVDRCFQCGAQEGVRRPVPEVECALAPDELARFAGRDERYGR